MRFLIDAQLPPALARWLAERGHEAVHVVTVGSGPRTTAKSGNMPSPRQP
jgi:predicted nuclease of predicted toxin-antitoxin system